jgi:C4-dicarboxylate-specific signal transduction histidine kinase
MMDTFRVTPETPDNRSMSADGLVRRLSTRYLLLLAGVALLVACDQALIQPLLVRVSSYAPAINAAGRQRMLSQRLTKAALALELADSREEQAAHRQELLTTLDEWSTAHVALRDGAGLLAPAGSRTPETSHAIAQLEPEFQAMSAAAAKLSESSGASESASSESSADIRVLLAHEQAYLPAMDHVVKLLETDAGRQIVWLRGIAVSIASAVLLLLAGVGWIVVRPATRTIRAQVHDLEIRVARRTADLSSANLALEEEMAAREAAEGRSRQLAAQLAHAVRVSTMGHLTAGLAHELNQPLAAISNYAEACDLLVGRTAAEEPRVQGHLDQIKRAAVRAGRIIQRMRNFLRPSENLRRPTTLTPLVREVAEFCAFEAERHGACIRVETADAEASVLADPIQIQQVLVNLIQNAIQAMEAGGGPQRRVTIQTLAGDEPDTVRVEVRDQGPGFSESQLESLFHPFFTTKPTGLGVGLAICRSIIEQHGGTIRAESAAACGAIVYFTLPRITLPHLGVHNVQRATSTDCIRR